MIKHIAILVIITFSAALNAADSVAIGAPPALTAVIGVAGQPCGGVGTTGMTAIGEPLSCQSGVWKNIGSAGIVPLSQWRSVYGGRCTIPVPNGAEIDTYCLTVDLELQVQRNPGFLLTLAYCGDYRVGGSNSIADGWGFCYSPIFSAYTIPTLSGLLTGTTPSNLRLIPWAY